MFPVIFSVFTARLGIISAEQVEMLQGNSLLLFSDIFGQPNHKCFFL